MSEIRKHQRRLKTLTMAKISLDSQLSRRHAERKWTRRWSVIGWYLAATFATIGMLLLAGAIVLVGLMLNGTYELGRWFGGMSISPSKPPLLAGWSILCTACSFGMALKIRQNPITSLYRPWGSHLPLSDRRLIQPLFGGLLPTAVAIALLSLGAFIPSALIYHWDVTQIARVVMMVMITIVTTWLLAEGLAAILPPTPMIQSTAITVVSMTFLAGVALSAVPRDVLEVRQPQSYAIIWRLPPAGWFTSISGLLPNSVHSSRYFAWALPVLGVACIAITWRWYRGTLQLEDIQMTTRLRQPAFRRGWLRSWTRPRTESVFARYKDKPHRLCELLSAHREKRLGETKWWQRILFPIRLSTRQLALLGLLGLSFPRRGRVREMAWGLWPIPFGLAMFIYFQYTSLLSFPRFLRAPFIFFFALSLFDFRELTGSINGQGESSLGFSANRSLFPIRPIDILAALTTNRLVFLVSVIPGWSVAICLLLQTDMPRDMIFNVPAIIATCSMLFPIYGTTAFCVSNLLSSWKSTGIAVPFSITSTASLLVFQLGVCGYMFAMRVDLAWLWLGVVALLQIGGSLLFFWLRKKLRVDDSTSSWAGSARFFR